MSTDLLNNKTFSLQNLHNHTNIEVQLAWMKTNVTSTIGIYNYNWHLKLQNK